MLEKAFSREPRLGRFLCHLFQRLSDGRLNLVTGAGISIDAGVPSWHGLLDRLAERSQSLKSDLSQHKEAGLHPEYLGQIIYHRHKNDWEGDDGDKFKTAHVENDWAKSIHDAIYRDVPGSIEDVVNKHPYFGELRDFSRKVPLVINFNFDDILADAIGRQIAVREGDRDRGFTVVWQPPLVDRTRTTTIYHVNGILPRVSLKKRSPQLIFTEDSFAAALSRSPGISGEYLFLRFVQNTMLIIGHSLGDSSLKNYLRLNKEKSPGNHHYHVHWMHKDDSLTQARRRDIFDANLELYNLITIFLTSEEINEFLSILNRDARDVRDFLDAASPERKSRYHFYIVGPVASGKSTLIEQLRCFNTFEEWTRPPPKIMYKASDKISEEENAEINEFVYGELKEKNIRMVDAEVGFHFMDRAPLDLYAFSKSEDENKGKTKDLLKTVCPDKPLQAGAIIFISASGGELVNRNLSRGRAPTTSGNEDYFEAQSKKLQEIYKPKLVFETDEIKAGELARRIARFALLEQYESVSLSEIMDRYS